MRRTLLTGCATLIALASVAITHAVAETSAPVGLKVRGKGKKQVLIPEQFEGVDRKRFELFAKRCTKCHPMARPIAALRTGITPVSGGVFDEAGVKKYVVKMMRKPNSGIGRSEARDILLFLRMALKRAQAAREAPPEPEAPPEADASPPTPTPSPTPARPEP